jgi:hypothetical protein
MATYRTYSNNDIVEGETTLTAAQKTNQRFADVLSWFPVTTGAAQHMVMTLASGLAGFVFTHILRSNVPLNHTGGNGTANQFLMGDGSGGTTWNHAIRSNVALNNIGGAGSAGQLFVSNGDNTATWVTGSINFAWSAQTSNFSIVDKGRYQVNGGLSGTLFVANSVNNEFYIKPAIGQDFTVNNFTLVRAGSESIANSASNFVCDVNAEYHFIANASGNWDVSISLIGRS